MSGHLRVAFWSKQLCEQGTEIALYDYADYAETLLGWRSFVFYEQRSHNNFRGTISKFVNRFGDRVIALPGDEEHQIVDALDTWLERNHIAHLYMIKCHVDDGYLPQTSVRTLVHSVFDATRPHGDVYCRISKCVPGDAPVLPHIVRPRIVNGRNLRSALGIPEGATVFGRHGGMNTFDIDFVREVIVDVASTRPDIFFVLLNTPPVCESDEPPNVKHLDATAEEERKCEFIRTCDAMLHARSCGETFGLAIAEFSAHNRPVITSSVHNNDGCARMHLDTLADQGLYYSDRASLTRILLEFDRETSRGKDWNCYRAFEPEHVMTLFKRLFLHTPAVSATERLPPYFAQRDRRMRSLIRMNRDQAFAKELGVDESIDCSDLF
mmetsp:Transcript_62258/g.103473  ORF Transcript_62258/g.103473 Transcript_62258/m.103473 type:complete len:381 (+) Transcript_62258:156-1298(+)|eukprot:CAMPEP_0119319466 /NCGR_PEP_ID=MMETSP1333-20130426/49483_1 /TAXON_ID=418940 /ORGANISM="Scyphosphaera apsteinii, Strain RCC1455" /LENGTH=380 /DNA_ID=CAMNT_0007325881 /DNA_START=156 /DNA_END=1298 /DNA_ORIENTATION=-